MAEDFDIGGAPPEEPTNRTFVIAAAGIGGLLVLSMICLALYALVLAPAQQRNRAAEATQIALQNTEVAQSITQTVAAARATATRPSTNTPVPPTATVTRTQVVVLPTDTPTATLPATTTSTPFTNLGTQSAQQTLNASGATTPSPTPTALPSTGFADEIGLPGLLVLGAALLVVVVVARRLRVGTSN
jgi:Tfp pilus assembly protein PilV